MPPLPLCLNKSEEKNETSFGNNCLHTTNWLLHVIHNIVGEWTPLELVVQCSRTLYFLNNKLTAPTSKIKIQVSKSCNNSIFLVAEQTGILVVMSASAMEKNSWSKFVIHLYGRGKDASVYQQLVQNSAFSQGYILVSGMVLCHLPF